MCQRGVHLEARFGPWRPVRKRVVLKTYGGKEPMRGFCACSPVVVHAARLFEIGVTRLERSSQNLNCGGFTPPVTLQKALRSRTYCCVFMVESIHSVSPSGGAKPHSYRLSVYSSAMVSGIPETAEFSLCRKR